MVDGVKDRIRGEGKGFPLIVYFCITWNIAASMYYYFL